VISVTRTFSVGKDPGVVIGYLKDFGNAVHWDPGTQSCERQDSGPVTVGSSWRNVSRFLGRETVLIYRLDTLQPDHLTFTGSNKTATSTDDITVTGSGGTGSEITYQARIQLNGLAALGTPVIRIAMERVANDTVSQIQQTIAAL
jgi:carbon monoxide dehydrogenase subunit G